MGASVAVRFGKTDWLEIGFSRLVAEGPGALTIEGLCQAAGRTRGSFYHHFQDREDFVREMMLEWRERSTEQAARRMQKAGNPAALRALLVEWPLSLDHELEKAFRRMAVLEPVVRRLLADLDRRRIDGLAAIVAAQRPELADPKAFALLLYAALVGSQWLLEKGDARAPALRAVGEALLWPEGAS